MAILLPIINMYRSSGYVTTAFAKIFKSPFNMCSIHE